MKIQQLRNLMIKLFLGALIAAAAIAVIAILAGSFNDIAWRAIWTIVSAMIHIGILFGILSVTDTDETNPGIVRSTNVVINSTILLAVLSFFTSIFGIWQVIDGELASKLYATYMILFVVILHAKTLEDVRVVYRKVQNYVLANYALIALVAGLIIGLIYLPDPLSLLSGFYGRLLAASVIVDVTLSVVVAVMYRLFIQRHPELAKSKKVAQSHYGGRIIVAILLFLFVGLPILQFLVAGLLFMH